MNATVAAHDFLEARYPNLYRELLHTAITNNGIIHATADCLLIATPLVADPQSIEILFAYGELKALFGVAKLLSANYHNITWQRQYKGKDSYFTTTINKLLKHTPQ